MRHDQVEDMRKVPLEVRSTLAKGDSLGSPGGDDRAEVPGRVVQRGDGRTVGGVGKLSDEKRRGETSPGETETDETTGGNEHADVLGSSLDSGSADHDEGAEEDSPATAKDIGEVGGEGKTDNTTDRLDSVEDTEESGLLLGVVEVRLPGVKRLQTCSSVRALSLSGLPFIIDPS